MKDEQKGKWMRPSCLLRMNTEESGCAPAVCCHRPPAAASLAAAPATSGVGYLCLAYPAAASHTVTTTTAAHTYSVAAIARTSTLPWSAGSTEDLSTSVPDVVALGSVISVRVCLVSPLGLICV